MERMLREIQQLVHPVPVIVDLVTTFTKHVTIRVMERQDTRAAGMQPVSGLFFAVAFF